MTTDASSETEHVRWHPDAVERAVEHARAVRARGGTIDNTPIYDLPLTWQDIAVLIDVAVTLDAERVDFASNSATVDYVTSSLNEMLDDYWQTRPENLAAALDVVRYNVAVLAWLHAEAKHERDQAIADNQSLTRSLEHYQDTEGYRLAIEQILDKALGRNAEDGTGEGIAADVAYLVRQRDEARAEADDLHDRARHIREDNHEGYAWHRDELIKALGQHADPTARTIEQLIERDVTALTEAYDTVEAELIEWRTGQRAVEASVMQWGEVTSKLDEALTAIRQVADHLTEDAQREQVSGELPSEEPFFPSTGLRATGINERAYLTLDDGTRTVVTTASLKPGPAAEPLKFTHDTED